MKRQINYINTHTHTRDLQITLPNDVYRDIEDMYIL